MSAVGPYRFYGEPVVKACAEAGTDYLDLCGEPGQGRKGQAVRAVLAPPPQHRPP
jgi:short subunit dehydrogenase-like uncharacterized protein